MKYPIFTGENSKFVFFHSFCNFSALLFRSCSAMILTFMIFFFQKSQVVTGIFPSAYESMRLSNKCYRQSYYTKLTLLLPLYHQLCSKCYPPKLLHCITCTAATSAFQQMLPPKLLCCITVTAVSCISYAFVLVCMMQKPILAILSSKEIRNYFFNLLSVDTLSVKIVTVQ